MLDMLDVKLKQNLERLVRLGTHKLLTLIVILILTMELLAITFVEIQEASKKQFGTILWIQKLHGNYVAP